MRSTSKSGTSENDQAAASMRSIGHAAGTLLARVDGNDVRYALLMEVAAAARLLRGYHKEQYQVELCAVSWRHVCIPGRQRPLPLAV